MNITTGDTSWVNNVQDTANTVSNTITWDTYAGTQILHFEPRSNDYGASVLERLIPSVETPKKKGKAIHPQLYFKYVKSKLTRLEQTRLSERLHKLQALVSQTKALGQQALYEKFAYMLATTVRESEALACGIEYIVEKSVIEKFMGSVREEVEIRLVKLENYDRVLPANVKKQIEKFQKLKLFDQLWILFGDHKEKEDVDGSKKNVKKIKTNKEKIKEKDPILFGQQNYEPDKLFFIIDWIDEHCDLTLEKFLETVRKDDPTYELNRIPEMNKKLMKNLLNEVKQKQNRLDDTKPSNYKGLMEEEDKENTLSLITNRMSSMADNFKEMYGKVKDSIRRKKDE